MLLRQDHVTRLQSSPLIFNYLFRVVNTLNHNIGRRYRKDYFLDILYRMVSKR
jgi:hypothetical protein